MEFTKDQQRVIDVRNRNILVSAAAGSGKTAVLVERIINMILDKDHPVDIDRLLVVTFTEAAALEMRERIGRAVQDRLDVDPLNEHLQKQSALLYKAQISTIHSFCLNVIRNNFNEIGLDPSFRVGDTTELKLMEEDVLDAFFEELYQQKDADFLELVNYFCKGVSDERLKEALLEVCHFAEGYPWPEEWLGSCMAEYDVSNKDFESLSWVKYLLEYLKARIEDVKPMIEDAEDLLNNPLAPACYYEIPRKDMEFVNSLLSAETYDGMRDILKEGFAKLPTAPKDSDKDFREEFKEKRDAYRKIITDTAKSAGVKTLTQFSSNYELENVQKIATVTKKLIKLAIDFIKRFGEERINKGVISFSDMEHFALNILYTSEDGKHVPSKTAIEYRDAFDEILMDEYQDCNRVQEEIMKAVCDEKTIKNDRFMVGDVKQSIYKFRLANPNLFIEKYNCYKTVDQTGRESFGEEVNEKIILHKNFRSRENVINTVNNLFGQIMKEDFGGVEYDEMAALVKGADYPDYPSSNIKEKSSTECMLLALNSESYLNKFEQEAHLVANRIKDLILNFTVTDKETKQLRPVQYKDIVILLRSMTQVAPAFKEILQKEGIPVFVSLNVGFFDTNEIQEVIQYLKVLDNPRQDIPLYGTLRSFFGGFTDEELAEIKIKCRDDVCLYDSLCALKEDNSKIRDFLELLTDYRKKSRYMPIHSLIEEIISESGYLEYETALPGGSQRRANLLLLVSKAASFEGTSYKGLFHFLRYIGRMKKIESDEGEADVLGQNDDVVRIMTIHKSKGLEFPICFLCATQKQFNMMDIRNDVAVDMDLGIGINLIDIGRNVRKTPLIRKVINLKIKQDILGEELRVLYVALTRAKEKLIITGTIDDEESFNAQSESMSEKIRKVGRMPFGDLSEAKSYLDFMVPLSKDFRIWTWEDLKNAAFVRTFAKTVDKGRLILEKDKLPDNDEDYTGLVSRISQKYSHPELEGMILKTSVSELKKQYIDLEFSEELFPETDSKELKAYEPAFLREQKATITGTERGNAYHKVMELLDFTDKDIKSQINKFVEKQLISKEWAEIVSVKKIESFLTTELASRMAKAQQNGLLHREQPFVLGIEANRVKSHYSKDETVLLQGIIDAFFIEENEIVLVDYKTDAIDNSDELRKRYSVQVEYYKEALERIWGMKVKETILYSFSLMEEVCS